MKLVVAGWKITKSLSRYWVVGL